jgi:hypothetical protein
MYLLLVTNRGSNILEDLETLRLLSKLVPEYAGVQVDEEAIAAVAFDLVFAFDEVISLGHKENITVQQVKQNCEMESHEEKLHKMIIQSKINDTKDIMKRKALEIDKHRVEARRVSGPSGLGGGPQYGMGGMGGGGMGMGGMDSGGISLGPAVGGSSGGYGGGGMGGGSMGGGRGGGGGIGAGAPKKGMVLGKAKAGPASLLESLAKEEGVAVAALDAPPAAGPAAAAAAAPPPVSFSGARAAGARAARGEARAWGRAASCVRPAVALAPPHSHHPTHFRMPPAPTPTPKPTKPLRARVCRDRGEAQLRAQPPGRRRVARGAGHAEPRRGQRRRRVHPRQGAAGQQPGLPVQDAPQHRQGGLQHGGPARPQGPLAAVPHGCVEGAAACGGRAGGIAGSQLRGSGAPPAAGSAAAGHASRPARTLPPPPLLPPPPQAPSWACSSGASRAATSRWSRSPSTHGRARAAPTPL